MPWVEIIEYLPADGAPVVEVDDREVIQALLDAWNVEHGPPRSPALGSCHGEGRAKERAAQRWWCWGCWGCGGADGGDHCSR